MKPTRDNGEPLSRGQLDRHASEARALRATVALVTLFVGAALVNGILAMLFIALMEAVGLWTPVAAETALISPDGADELRTSLRSLIDRGHPTTT